MVPARVLAVAASLLCMLGIAATAHASNAPAGYVKVFEDEFDGPNLNTNN